MLRYLIKISAGRLLTEQTADAIDFTQAFSIAEETRGTIKIENAKIILIKEVPAKK